MREAGEKMKHSARLGENQELRDVAQDPGFCRDERKYYCFMRGWMRNEKTPLIPAKAGISGRTHTVISIRS
jgi:hypothetical protein